VPKRKPIDYKAQFAPGVFRAPEEIESDLEALDQEDEAAAPDSVTRLDTTLLRPTHDIAQPPRPNVRTNERTSERSTAPSARGAPEPRRRIRHSFDIWEDQLLSLAEIQSQLFTTTRRKPKLGELVQEALDAYIRRHRTRANEHPNVRTNERTP
jgi:hypothetical protein